MSRLDHIIPSAIAEASSNPGQVQRQTAIYGAKPALRAREAWTGAGLTRTLTIQVINQRREDCKGLYLVSVVLGTDGATADPSYTITTGTELDEFTVALGGLFITGAAGALVLSVTQASWVDLVPLVAAICPFDGEAVAGWTPVDAAPPVLGDPSEYMFDDDTNAMLIATM